MERSERGARNKPYTIEEFWANRIVDANGCWIWQGSLDGEGYGRIMYGGKRWKTHRLAWVFIHGEIPSSMKVCHSCDVRPCINPDHHWLGTQADNVADMEAKGRGRRTGVTGERNPMAVLTADQVEEIRAIKGVSGRQIAFRYGVSPMTISRILNNQMWKGAPNGSRN